MHVSFELIRHILGDHFDFDMVIQQSGIAVIDPEALVIAISEALKLTQEVAQARQAAYDRFNAAKATLDDEHHKHDSVLADIRQRCPHRERHTNGECKACGHNDSPDPMR